MFVLVKFQTYKHISQSENSQGSQWISIAISMAWENQHRIFGCKEPKNQHDEHCNTELHLKKFLTEEYALIQQIHLQ